MRRTHHRYVVSEHGEPEWHHPKSRIGKKPTTPPAVNTIPTGMR